MPDPGESAPPDQYLAYLLRLWSVTSRAPGSAGDAVTVTWHATLEEVASRELLGFDSVETLCAFLHTLTHHEVG